MKLEEAKEIVENKIANICDSELSNAWETLMEALIIRTDAEGIETYRKIIKFCEDVIKIINEFNPENKDNLLIIAKSMLISYQAIIVVKEE